MSDAHDGELQPQPDGAFPLTGPVTYLTDDEDAARAMLDRGEFPAPTTWWHVTDPARLPTILAKGLVPGCWRGGDTCAVFGIDALADAPGWRRHDWILEIHSAALSGQAKAWWVPPAAIRGAWRFDTFISARLLHDAYPLEAPPSGVADGCPCSLTRLSRDQQAAWRATWR
jgi:hypothetical protein